MKLNLQRETLLTPLQMVIGVVEKKQTLPILSNVLLQLQGEYLIVTGTDLEVELIGTSKLATPTKHDISLTIPGRKLIDICKALPEQAPIELLQKNHTVILTSGNSRFSLATLPAEDFPDSDNPDTHLKFNIAQTQLLQLLQKTYFSMAQQDVRYYLNGLLLEISDNIIRAVATDGHRLATTCIEQTVQTDHRSQIIVPRKGVVELIRLLQAFEGDLQVAISSNHIEVSSAQFTYRSKLVDGRFPDYERVIPMQCNKSALISREAFKQTLSRSAILCNEKSRGIRLSLKPNSLKIKANNAELEAAEDEVVIDYTKDPLEIAFNVNYLLDILNNIDSEEIRLSFADANSSVLIEGAGKSSNSLYVVMPMRL